MGTDLHEAILDGAGEIARAGVRLDACASASCSCRCSSSPAWRASCSCRWPRPWCSPCSPPTSCRAPWCRPWRCCCMTAPRTAPAGGSASLLQRLYQRFDAGFERCAAATLSLLSLLLRARTTFASAVLRLLRCLAGRCTRCSGRISSPRSTPASIRLHMRAPTGTRIEETARSPTRSTQAIRDVDPGRRTRHHPRQHRPALQRHQPLLQQRRHHRHARRRDPDLAEARTTSPTERHIVTLLRAELPRALPGRRVLLPARRHRHPDPQFRPARGRSTCRFSGPDMPANFAIARRSQREDPARSLAPSTSTSISGWTSPACAWRWTAPGCSSSASTPATWRRTC